MNLPYDYLTIFDISKQLTNHTIILKVENLLISQTMKEPKIAFTFIRKHDPNTKGTYAKFYLDVGEASLLAQKILTNPTNGFRHQISKGNRRNDNSIESRIFSIEVQSKHRGNKDEIQTILRAEKFEGEITKYITVNNKEIPSEFRPKIGHPPLFSAVLTLSLDETVYLATAINFEIMAWRVYIMQNCKS